MPRRREILRAWSRRARTLSYPCGSRPAPAAIDDWCGPCASSVDDSAESRSADRGGRVRAFHFNRPIHRGFVRWGTRSNALCRAIRAATGAATPRQRHGDCTYSVHETRPIHHPCSGGDRLRPVRREHRRPRRGLAASPARGDAAGTAVRRRLDPLEGRRRSRPRPAGRRDGTSPPAHRAGLVASRRTEPDGRARRRREGGDEAQGRLHLERAPAARALGRARTRSRSAFRGRRRPQAAARGDRADPQGFGRLERQRPRRRRQFRGAQEVRGRPQ